jgi:hypothetical protein
MIGCEGRSKSKQEGSSSESISLSRFQDILANSLTGILAVVQGTFRR